MIIAIEQPSQGLVRLYLSPEKKFYLQEGVINADLLTLLSEVVQEGVPTCGHPHGESSTTSSSQIIEERISLHDPKFLMSLTSYLVQMGFPAWQEKDDENDRLNQDITSMIAERELRDQLLMRVPSLRPLEKDILRKLLGRT